MESDYEIISDESDYNYVEYQGSQININYKRFYEDLNLRKWERVISEENIEDEECKEAHM
jgi:hypothetical protein